jgi:hypothetical protein
MRGTKLIKVERPGNLVKSGPLDEENVSCTCDCGADRLAYRVALSIARALMADGKVAL